MVSDDQYRILQAIKTDENPNTSSDTSIVKRAGLTIDLVRYYLEELRNSGYLEVRTGVDHMGDTTYPLCFLTPKGKVAATQPDKILPSPNSVINNLTISGSSVNAPIGIFQNSDSNTFNANQSIDTKIAETMSMVDSFYEAVEPLPETEREFSRAYLDNLKEEITSLDRRKPVKIKAAFAAFVAVVLPLMSLVANSTDFLNNLTDFGQRIGVEIPQLPKQP